MELPLTAEQEAHLAEIAQHQGTNPGQLVFDAALHLLDGDRLFREAVQRGLDQADAGNLIDEREMDARFEAMISRASAR